MKINKLFKMFFLFFFSLILCFGFSIHKIYIQSYRCKGMIKRTGSLLKNSIKHRQGSHQIGPSTGSLFVLYGKLIIEQLVEQDYQLRQRIFSQYIINYFSPHDLSLLVHEIFVRKIYTFFTQNDKPLIIDCGSNIGVSILFFKTMYPNATIIGFEPHPTTFKILQKNIVDNNLLDVIVHNFALYDHDKGIHFSESLHAPGHPGMSANESSTNSIIVRTVCLSKYITKEIDFLKMDIEGSEGVVIRDLAQNKKLNLIKQMIIEFHDNGDNDNCLIEILQVLHNHNFYCLIHSEVDVPFSQEKSPGTLIYAYSKN